MPVRPLPPYGDGLPAIASAYDSLIPALRPPAKGERRLLDCVRRGIWVR